MISYFYLFTDISLLIRIVDGFKFSFCFLFIIEILISLAVLPFLIRLSGQLLVQTLKYRETIKNASDPEEHRPYYEHYRIMFCLLFVMLLFNVFNLIKAFYLIKPLFVYYVEPISLNLVLNFWLSFQDAIISFGLISMIQIIYFLNEKRVKMSFYILLGILRFFWIFLAESGLIASLIVKEKAQLNIFSIYFVPCILFVIEFIYLLRVVMIFRFAKEGNDIVKKLVNRILADNNLRDAMGHERVENIYRASVLFRCLSWGNFILSVLFAIPLPIEGATIFIMDSSDDLSVKIFEPSVFFNELLFFLSSLLYLTFFIILWKLLYNRSRTIRFRGYSHFSESFNMNIHNNEATPILTPMNFSFKKLQTYLIRYYSLVIAGITVLMVGFITPLGINGWSTVLFVHPGDFYRLKYTNVYKEMESCSRVTAEVYFNPHPYYYPPPHCDSIYFATIGDSATLYQNYSFQLSYSGEKVLWVPPNTTITRLEYIDSLNISTIIPTDVPCMTAAEQSFALEQRLVIFDCVLPEYKNTKFIANCSNSNQCRSFHETILTKSSMINIAVDLSNVTSTLFLLKQTYNLSNLSSVKPVMDFRNSGEFDFQKYDILINNKTYRDLWAYDACPIKFSCTLHYAIGITIALFTLISIPVYLMSVILIHRH